MHARNVYIYIYGFSMINVNVHLGAPHPQHPVESTKTMKSTESQTPLADVRDLS